VAAALVHVAGELEEARVPLARYARERQESLSPR